MTLDELNEAAERDAVAILEACCAIPRWAGALAARRPYRSVDALLDRADRESRNWSGSEVDRAVAAHPRIGQKPAGGSREAAWSRREQAGVEPDAATELAEANAAYEHRFERVFLICATGLSSSEILAALRARLGNDDPTEAAVVANELRTIALLRIRKAIEP